MQRAYGYFAHSPKRHLELSHLSTLLEIEGRKLMKNVKQHWMGIFPCISRVLAKYKPLILKMLEDAKFVPVAKLILTSLLDIQNVLALPLLMPLLHSIDYLIKFAQSHDVFIVDYISTVKSCQNELFFYYVEEITFCHENFQQFYDIIENTLSVLSLEWVTDLN